MYEYTLFISWKRQTHIHTHTFTHTPTHSHANTHAHKPCHKPCQSIRTLPEPNLTHIRSLPLPHTHITSFNEHIRTVSEQTHTYTHAHTLSQAHCPSPTRTFTQSHTSRQSMKAFEHYVSIFSPSLSPFLPQAHAYKFTHTDTNHARQRKHSNIT